MDTTEQSWPQLFRQLAVTNCHYWLQCAQKNVNTVLPETPQILQALRYALPLPEAWEPARNLLLHLSPWMIRQGQAMVWQNFLTKAIARSAEEQDAAGIEIYLQLGHLYRLQGRLSEARHCFQQALNLCRQYKLNTHNGTLLNQLGFVARLSGQHEEALACCRQVLARQALPLSEQAEALNVQGLVAHDHNQWDEALRCFEQALTLYRSLDAPHQVARMLNNRGLVLFRSHRWAEAEENYREAIKLFQAANDQAERFKAVMNLGNVFLMRAEFQTAIKQYHQALPIFQQCNYVVDLAHVYNNLGMAYTGLADWRTANDYFLASINVWQNLEDGYNLANVLDNLGDMFIKAGQPEKANQALQKALETLDTVPNSPATTYLKREIQAHLKQLHHKEPGRIS